MFRILLAVCLLLFILPQCKNKNASENIVDTFAVTNNNSREDESLIINNQTPQWVYKTLSSTAFNEIKNEEYGQGDSLAATRFITSNAFYKTYASLLRWSPDSNFVLDIGSYGRVLIEDSAGNTNIDSGEPDTEVALIDPKKQKRTRLMFVGPSTEILDGNWINTSQVLIMGTFKEISNKADTLIWMVDISNGRFKFYDIKK